MDSEVSQESDLLLTVSLNISGNSGPARVEYSDSELGSDAGVFLLLYCVIGSQYAANFPPLDTGCEV